MDEFIKQNYLDGVASDTDSILEQVVAPIQLPSDLLLSVEMTDVIVNEVDMLYYAGFLIGTPGQSLTFDIDTGSSDLWVPSPLCSACTDKNSYDGTQSSTYEDKGRKFAVSYVSALNTKIRKI